MSLWLWTFWTYSFLGYLLERGYAIATHADRQARKCFLLLPMCPVYGLGALAVLALIRVDGEQIFCPVEAFTKGVSWPIVMAVASMAAIGGLLVADEYGIKAWLTQALGGLFSNHSPLLFVAMTVLITLVLTNFFSNTATLLVVSSLVSALSGPLVDAGYDITILAVAISLSSMVAYLTYASSGQAAILLSQKNMDNKFIWTYGIAAMLLYAAVVILVSAVCLFF